MKNSRHTILRHTLPLALLLAFGAALGTGSVEFAKRSGFGPFAAAVQHGTAAQAMTGAPGMKPVALHTASVACSCGAVAARRPLFRPVALALRTAPHHSAMKPAGDCMQAQVVDGQDPAAALAEVSVEHEALKMPGAIAPENFVAYPLNLVAGNAVAGTMAAVTIADPAEFGSGLFADPMIGASFGGGTGYVGVDGPLASMNASESFGAPILFAATSNPDTGGNGGGLTSVVVDTPTVPEPAPLALFALGMLCLVASRSRKVAARVSR